MYVRNHMLAKEELTIVDLKDNVGDALEKIEEGNFLSLPVFDGKEFRGIIMKEAVYRYYFDVYEKNNRDEFLKEVKVESIYNSLYRSIKEEELIEDASYLLKELSTPFLPVLNKDEEFVGILTHFAIFKAFSDLFGFDKGTKVVINMLDTPGQLARLTEVIRKENINIMNLAVMDAKVLGVYRVTLRLDTDNPEKIINKITRAGFKIGDISN